MVDVSGWYGVFAPRAASQPIIDRNSTEFDNAIQDPDIKEKMALSSLGPMGETAKDFQIDVKKTLDAWARVVKETGVRVD